MTSNPQHVAAAYVYLIYGLDVSGIFVVIGIQFFICIYGTIVFFESPRRLRQGRGIYITISFAILLLSCTSAVGGARQILEALLASRDPGGVLIFLYAHTQRWWTISSTISTWVVTWIGDGLLIYRCHIIWGGNRWISFPLGMIYLASVAVSIYTGIDLVKAFQQMYYYNWRAMAAWICLSVAVNCLVTSLIAYRLISMRRSLAKVMTVSVQDRNSKTYLGVLSILIESALPLSISGILFVAFINPSKTITSAVANSVFNYLWFSFSALSPQMIIFRVTMGRSWTQRPVGSKGEESIRLSNIEFNLNMLESPSQQEVEAAATHRREQGLGLPNNIHLPDSPGAALSSPQSPVPEQGDHPQVLSAATRLSS